MPSPYNRPHQEEAVGTRSLFPRRWLHPSRRASGEPGPALVRGSGPHVTGLREPEDCRGGGRPPGGNHGQPKQERQGRLHAKAFMDQGSSRSTKSRRRAPRGVPSSTTTWGFPQRVATNTAPPCASASRRTARSGPRGNSRSGRGRWRGSRRGFKKPEDAKISGFLLTMSSL